MPDQIDLSRMESVPVQGPNGYLRLHRYWRTADESLWDQIWDGTPSKDYWRHGLAGHLPGAYADPFRKHLEPKSAVLEAGCGLGHVVLALRQWGHDCHGLDYAERTVRELTRVFPDVPFKQGDIRLLPYEAGAFDAYISLGVIEHFTEGHEHMLAEARRVLRPGGRIFLSVPVLNAYRRLRIRLGTYRKASSAPFFEACFQTSELAFMLREAGFRVIEHRYQNPVMTFVQESPLRPLYRL
ncbi:MAG: class I SAM-dependent methyltransferase, partial [Planctomycetes bacterium]|nr:class I SAM-dependent methyltransferase [Planctomycetota bacterium]